MVEELNLKYVKDYKIMNGWEAAGNGLEAKITKRGQIMIREAGKYPSNDDYPHFIAKFDSQGNLIDHHSSESRYGSRFGTDEIIMAALTIIRGKGML